MDELKEVELNKLSEEKRQLKNECDYLKRELKDEAKIKDIYLLEIKRLETALDFETKIINTALNTKQISDWNKDVREQKRIINHEIMYEMFNKTQKILGELVNHTILDDCFERKKILVDNYNHLVFFMNSYLSKISNESAYYKMIKNDLEKLHIIFASLSETVYPKPKELTEEELYEVQKKKYVCGSIILLIIIVVILAPILVVTIK